MDVVLCFADMMEDDSSYNFAGGIIGLEDHAQPTPVHETPCTSYFNDKNEYDTFFNELLTPAVPQAVNDDVSTILEELKDEDLVFTDLTNMSTATNDTSSQESSIADLVNVDTDRTTVTQDVCSQKSTRRELEFVDIEDMFDDTAQSFDSGIPALNNISYSGPLELSQPDSVSSPNMNQTDTVSPPNLNQTDSVSPPNMNQTDTVSPPNMSQTDSTIPPNLSQTDSTSAPNLNQTDTASQPILDEPIAPNVESSKQQLKCTPREQLKCTSLQRKRKERRFRPVPALYKMVLKRRLMNQDNMFWYQCCDNYCQYRWKMVKDWEIRRALCS